MSDVVDKKQKLLIEYLCSCHEAFIKAYSILKPSYFEPPLDRAVEFVLDHFAEYHTIPNFDVIEAETDIAFKDREVEPTEIKWLVDEIEDHCQKQAMTQAILESVDLINDGRMNEVLDLTRNALCVGVDKSIGVDLFDDPMTRIMNTNLGVDERYTGIKALDDIVGKVGRGQLMDFAAGTSVGKSVMLANIADRMAQQKLDCLILSVEMNEAMYSRRLDSILTGVPLSSTPDVEAITSGLDALRDNYGSIVTKRVNSKFGLEDLRALFMEYHLTHGKYPDVFILDYLDIFANGCVPRGVTNKFDWDEMKTHSVRDLMEEFSMYGFTASQGNRDSYGITEVGPQHIGGGLSKSQGCDNVIFMIATEEDLDNNCWSLKGVKLRNVKRTSTTTVLYKCPETLKVGDQPFTGVNHTAPKTSGSPVASMATKKPDPPPSRMIKESGKNSLPAGKDKLKQALDLIN